MSDRTRVVLAQFPTPTLDGRTWTYSGWCGDCFTRAVEPGRDVCPACTGWAGTWDAEGDLLHEYEREMAR